MTRSITRTTAITLAILVAALPAWAAASPTASLVEVPISPAAIAADPALANFRTFDLRVNILLR